MEENDYIQTKVAKSHRCPLRSPGYVRWFAGFRLFETNCGPNVKKIVNIIAFLHHCMKSS